MDDKLLHKWLNDELTEQERQEFEARPDFEFSRALLEDAAAFKAEQFSSPPAFSEIKTKLPERKQDNQRYMRPLMQVAAAFVVAFGLYFALFYNNITSVDTLVAQQKTVVLPDASEVILNSGSSISYDAKSWEEAREVKLSGEAYFKVAKGQVFDVITEDGKISVLGTEFNVIQRQNYFDVICYEGKVEVTFGDAKTILTPGKAVRLYNGEALSYDLNALKPSWLDAKSSFNAVTLAIVMDELERQYDVKVMAPQKVKERKFSGAFTHNDLQQALNQITAPLQLNYQINGKEVTISE